MRLLGSCLFCCVLSIGSASALGQARMFYVPAGTDPTTTTPGEAFVAQVTPGTTIGVEVFVEDVGVDLGALLGYSVSIGCAYDSSSGGGELTHVAGSVVVDSLRPDWALAGAGPGFAIPDQGSCDESIACTTNADCPPNTLCGDDDICTTSPPRAAGALFGGNTNFTEPRYLGNFEVDIPDDASGEYFLAPNCLPKDGCPLGSETSLDPALAYVFDGLVLQAPLPQPEIVHETGLDDETQPFSGYVDPRMESNNGADFNLGLTSCKIRFSTPVFGGPNQEPVTASNFVLSQTGGGTAPTATSATMIDGDPTYYEVTWDRTLTPSKWTTIRAIVSNSGGDPIKTLGDLGPGMNEPDRIDFGFLPCDTNQNGQCSPIDLFVFRGFVTGANTPPNGLLTDVADIDRSGAVSPIDLFRFRQLVNGVGASTQPWSLVSIPDPRP
jgi:hypothetical protein